MFGFFGGGGLIVTGVVDVPYFEAAGLLVAYLAAEEALGDIFLGAFAGFVPDTVALEAELGVAVEGVVRVGATQDAVEAGAFVGTLAGHVAELFAVAALYGGVVVEEVPGLLVLQFGEHVVLCRQEICVVLVGGL